jgi:hypothetical protein
MVRCRNNTGNGVDTPISSSISQKQPPHPLLKGGDEETEGGGEEGGIESLDASEEVEDRELH